MKFKVIDAYTLKCLLTEDDMMENDIELEDFFHDKEKIHDFMEKIMDKAKDEIGYELMDEILTMQLMPLPKNGLAITISGNTEKNHDELTEDDERSLSAMIDEDIAAALGEGYSSENTSDLNNMEMISQEILDEVAVTCEPDLKSRYEELPDKVKKKIEESLKELKGNVRIFYFKHLQDVEHYCASISHPKYITSALFKDEERGAYYLSIEQRRMTIQTFTMLCEKAMEYGEPVSASRLSISFMKEHFQNIIHKNAIPVMRKIMFM